MLSTFNRYVRYPIDILFNISPKDLLVTPMTTYHIDMSRGQVHEPTSLRSGAQDACQSKWTVLRADGANQKPTPNPSPVPPRVQRLQSRCRQSQCCDHRQTITMGPEQDTAENTTVTMQACFDNNQSHSSLGRLGDKKPLHSNPSPSASGCLGSQRGRITFPRRRGFSTRGWRGTTATKGT